MKKEDKELLLKDISARLPYKLVCEVKFREDGKYKTSNMFLDGVFNDEAYFTSKEGSVYSNDYKPYLFPLSSMTEEQKNECFKGTPLELDKYGDIAAKCDFYGGCQYADLKIYLEVIVWLLKNHFDIYGLIPMGLAIDATGKNIY